MASSSNTAAYTELPLPDVTNQAFLEELSVKHANMRLSCSPSRFAETIEGLDDHHKKAICSQTGLGGLTQMKSVSLRRIMLVLLAKSYISNKQSIHIAGKDIPITPTDVYKLMDLPIEGEDILVKTGKPKDANLLMAYQTGGRLKLSDLEDKIRASKTPDDHFIRRFVLYAIGIILAPTLQDYVDTKYFVLVEDVKRIPNFNWGCFTLNHLLTSINTFNYKDQVNLQGNLALLQVFMNIGDLEPTNITNDQRTNKDTDAHEDATYQPQPRGPIMSSQQMDMILQTMNDQFAELEKKLVKQVLEVEHKLDKKINTLAEDLINIKGKIATQPRLSKLEDEFGDLKREVHELRSLLQTNKQSTTKNAYVQEQDQTVNGKFSSTPQFDAWKVRTSARTPSAKVVVQNKELDKDILPQKRILNNDYVLTEEDYEAGHFILGSHDLVEVVDIGDVVLTVDQLKRNVSKRFFIDDVIDAYAHISNVATDSTSFISTVLTRRLLGEFGGIPMGCKSPWVATVAAKFVGRRMVHVPMNVHDIHWLLLVFNFDKEEIQVLNSNQSYRDMAKETALVNSIQACINEAIEDGLVTPPNPINIIQWKTICYPNIPQQTDGYSCGAYTLKYMLKWDGNQITEDFTQAQIHIFSWKICSSLLYSDCNKLRKSSYKNPITEDEYEASIPVERKGADDDVTIINPDVTNKPDTSGAPKRKRGRPRKNAPPSNPVKQLFDTETIAKQVELKGRKRKPSSVMSSPYVEP